MREKPCQLLSNRTVSGQKALQTMKHEKWSVPRAISGDGKNGGKRDKRTTLIDWLFTISGVMDRMLQQEQ